MGPFTRLVSHLVSLNRIHDNIGSDNHLTFHIRCLGLEHACQTQIYTIHTYSRKFWVLTKK